MVISAPVLPTTWWPRRLARCSRYETWSAITNFPQPCGRYVSGGTHDHGLEPAVPGKKESSADTLFSAIIFQLSPFPFSFPNPEQSERTTMGTTRGAVPQVKRCRR